MEIFLTPSTASNKSSKKLVLTPTNKRSRVKSSAKARRFEIRLSDCISYLQSLPDNSVDCIITDPAYSGMNQHLKLGNGRIVGEYKDKGESGRWFEEFHDTEENYIKFLTIIHL